MVQFTSKLVLATIVVVPAFSAPLADREALKARGPGMSSMAKSALKNGLDSLGKKEANDALKKYTGQPVQVDPAMATASKIATDALKNPAAVKAVADSKHAATRPSKREFEDGLYERDFEDNLLNARGQGMSSMTAKGAKEVLNAVGQDQAKDTLKKHTSQPVQVDPAMATAAKIATDALKNPAAVKAVVSVKQGDPAMAAAAKIATNSVNPAAVRGAVGKEVGKRPGKREFDDDLYERDFEEDVFERDFYDIEERGYLEELD